MEVNGYMGLFPKKQRNLLLYGIHALLLLHGDSLFHSLTTSPSRASLIKELKIHGT